MPVNASLYDTRALVANIELMKPPSTFLTDTFFPNVQYSDTEFVSIDVFTGKRRLAPFCSPLVEGKIVESLGYTTNDFKPAYIKLKNAMDPLRPVRRMRGERIGGNISPAEREQANLIFEQEQHIQMIQRRLEWMAASALSGGTITVSGEGVPTTVITFGRDSGQTLTLTGGSRWGQSGVRPNDNLDTWSATVLQNSGLVVTDVVFSLGAWQEFRQDPTVLNVILSPQNGNAGLQAEGARPMTGAMNMGVFNGRNLWVYNDWYIDPADNTEKPMLAANTVLLVSRGMEGTQAFGSIIDPEFSYQALPYAPKSWVEKDPAVRYLMTQSAPLVIPSAVNGAMAVVVK
jgi:hypothetical protein